MVLGIRPHMKQKFNKKFRVGNSRGFTIVELLVVLSIMGLMGTVLIVNFNSTRSRRNLTLATNELTSNIRKTQSYALSARDVSAGVPAKFYVVQFDFSVASNQYQILAIDNNYTPKPTLVETVNLPTDVIFDAQDGTLTQPIGTGTPTSPSCIQIIFSLPFGKIYMKGSTGVGCNSDYVDELKDPSALATMANSEVELYLRTMTPLQEFKDPTYYNKTVTINGLSGSIDVQ